ncbi:Putative ubiquitin fusion degradation protein Ufd1 [Septoria linicola]|uniref:Ubiquitin fusion degradation protein 1 n=1 Tax=Septoria linicola TaxID=215465 RepID=A0A9Q9ALB9_9PEZI|nr:putative ubiquitin fusion degradation protein Ufd1 [Septoria linicola]USW51532.1 Putative ubiquitin fusion degradation protein Ufd1 [Septoria linicola]
MSYYYDNTDPLAMYRAGMMGGRGAGGRARRFDEYYRCYPIAMMPGPERESANHGGKMFLPASALDKLTQLHIEYPMLFELINGTKQTSTHAGVLEFTAEEGRCYLPFWMMQTLMLEPGDLIQTKSTSLPPGRFIKLQPQTTNFLDISDPKAVLEQAFRGFSCMSKGDVFTFSYNDTVYEIAVLEVKPEGEKSAISVQETDLEVDFAPPIGYEEPKQSGTSTPHSIHSKMGAMGGAIHPQGSMAQSINYDAIKPSSDQAAKSHEKANSHFAGAGQRLVAKKGKGTATATPTSTPGTSTPISNAGGGVAIPGFTPKSKKNQNGPEPLRLGPNKLFFGYDIVPLKNKEEQAAEEQNKKVNFEGAGNTLRKKK